MKNKTSPFTVSRRLFCIVFSGALAAVCFGHAFVILSHAGTRSSPRASVTVLGLASSENFNSLANSGTQTQMPSGWEFLETLSNANLTYGADNGGSNSGNTYSYGATGSSERAFGTLRSSGLASTIGASYANASGKTVSAAVVSFTGEQWRLGSTARNDRLEFAYSTDATSLAGGTWISDARLNFVAPQGTASPVPSTGAQNGNASANRVAVSSTISGLSLAQGKALYLRWTDFDAAGSDDGLALDDFSIAFFSIPETSIDSAPAVFSGSSAAFAFSSDNQGSTFECDLDSRGFAPCGAQTLFTQLSEGRHSLSVRAVDPAGVDPTPAVHTWTADTAEPNTILSTAVPSYTNARTQSFEFSGTDDGSGVSGFECRTDSGPFVPCTAPRTLTDLAEGRHEFSVRARDAAGNVDATPASVIWNIDLTSPTVMPSTALTNTSVDAARVWSLSATDASGVADVTLTYRVAVATDLLGEESAPAFGPSLTVQCVEGTEAHRFECVIPGQPVGSVVSYFATATDSAGNEAFAPSPDAPNGYAVGAVRIPSGIYGHLQLDSRTTLSSSVTITESLDLDGIVRADHAVILGPGAMVTGAGPTSYIDGPVTRWFGGTGSFAFPVGSGAVGLSDGGYSPLDVTVSSSSAGSTLTVTAIASPIAEANTAMSLARRWEVVETGDVTATMKFHYAEEDVRGVAASYRVMRKSGTNLVYHPGGGVDAASRTFTAADVDSSSVWSAGSFGSTAAGVAIEGRVMNTNGIPLGNVTVMISGGNPNDSKSVRTNQFGRYIFDDLEVGQGYVLRVISKRFTFANPERFVQLFDAVATEDFVALPQR